MTPETTQRELTLDQLNTLIQRAAALNSDARDHTLHVDASIHNVPRHLFDQCACAQDEQESTIYTQHGTTWTKLHPSCVVLFCDEPPAGHVDKTWCIAKNGAGVMIAIREHDVADGWTVVKKDMTRDELDYELGVLRATDQDEEAAQHVEA